MIVPPFGGKVRPFSAEFRDKLNEVSESAMTWEQERASILERIRILESAPVPIISFPVVLNIAKVISGQNNRWAYGWEEFMPGLPFSSYGFPGCGASATSTPSSWVFDGSQRKSWSSSGSYAATNPYVYYAINLAEIANDAVGAGTTGYVSYGQKVGAGPSGSGSVSLLSVGNVADSTAANRRNVIVMMHMFSVWADDTGTAFDRMPKIYPNDSGLTNGYKSGTMFAFSAGNEVEVSCS